jgi:hypothetical protein
MKKPIFLTNAGQGRALNPYLYQPQIAKARAARTSAGAASKSTFTPRAQAEALEISPGKFYPHGLKDIQLLNLSLVPTTDIRSSFLRDIDAEYTSHSPQLSVYWKQPASYWLDDKSKDIAIHDDFLYSVARSLFLFIAKSDRNVRGWPSIYSDQRPKINYNNYKEYWIPLMKELYYPYKIRTIISPYIKKFPWIIGNDQYNMKKINNMSYERMEYILSGGNKDLYDDYIQIIDTSFLHFQKKYGFILAYWVDDVYILEGVFDAEDVEIRKSLHFLLDQFIIETTKELSMYGIPKGSVKFAYKKLGSPKVWGSIEPLSWAEK